MKGLYNIILFILLSFCSSVLIAQTTLDEIVNDMILPHEGRPHGVPSSANWSYNPRVGAVEPPADWNAAIAWGQLYEWSAGNPATNTRVQIKDLELYYLSKIDHKWHLLQKSARVGGANYVEDFHDDLNKPADIKYPVDGGVSVTCGDGYNFHFWPTSGRIKFPANEVAGCFVTVKAKLILANPEGNDDRDSAKFVMSVGGDWWLSLTAQWDQWKTNADMGIGRFRFVTPEWKSFNMYSVPKIPSFRILLPIFQQAHRLKLTLEFHPLHYFRIFRIHLKTGLRLVFTSLNLTIRAYQFIPLPGSLKLFCSKRMLFLEYTMFNGIQILSAPAFTS